MFVKFILWQTLYVSLNHHLSSSEMRLIPDVMLHQLFCSAWFMNMLMTPMRLWPGACWVEFALLPVIWTMREINRSKTSLYISMLIQSGGTSGRHTHTHTHGRRIRSCTATVHQDIDQTESVMRHAEVRRFLAHYFEMLNVFVRTKRQIVNH